MIKDGKEILRTYEDIVEDYLMWVSEIYDDVFLEPKNYFESFESDRTEDRRKIEYARIYKLVLENCYHPVYGGFYFQKFILGDMKKVLSLPEKIHYNKLWLEWDKLMVQYDHLCLACQRGGGKSLRMTIIETLKRSFLYTGHRTIIVGASEGHVSDETIKPIKRLILSNQALRSKTPKSIKKSKWTSSYLTYNRGYIIGKGVGGAIRGRHVDLVVLDDILSDASSKSVSNQSINAYVFETLDPMTEVRRGDMILIGTPQGLDDIFHHITEKIDKNPETSWHFEKYPAILSYEDKKVQLPSRFTFERLMQKKIDLGSRRFEKEYQVSFLPESNALFPSSYLSTATDKGKDLILKYKHKNNPDENRAFSYYIGVDLARSGAVSADNSVFTVIKYFPKTEEKQVTFIKTLHGVKIQNQVETIARIARKFHNCVVMVEENNIGMDFIDLLVDKYAVHVEKFKTTLRSKDNLIRLLISNFEHEKIILPYGNEETREKIDKLTDELRRFRVQTTYAGNEVYKGLPHDDRVISLALAVKAAYGHGGNVPIVIDKFEKTSKKSDLVQKIHDGIIK